jgi:hypothetical protein
MPIAATRDVPFVHPRPSLIASVWSRGALALRFAVETMREAYRDAREAHRRYPFVDW